MRTLILAGLLVVAALALAPAAMASRDGLVGWIRADTYAEQSSRPNVYWPGNILDGRNATVWCVEGGPRAARGQSLRIGFKSSVEVERVAVTTGDNRSQEKFASSNRITKLTINDGRYRRTLDLADKRGRQLFQLSPPVRGRRATITIQGIEGEEDLTCLTGVVFQREDGSALNGPFMRRHLAYDEHRSPLVGVWAHEQLAAPQRFLTLFLDGTYRYSYRPHDPIEDEVDLTGSYRVSEDSLRLRVDGSWRSVEYERVSGRDELGESFVRLELAEADEELEEMEGTWHVWSR